MKRRMSPKRHCGTSKGCDDVFCLLHRYANIPCEACFAAVELVHNYFTIPRQESR